MKFVFFILLIIVAFVSQNHITLAQDPDLPQDAARCEEKAVLVSKCRGAKPRVYYNAETNECVDFLYGGCGANGNIFNTQEECEKLCKK